MAFSSAWQSWWHRRQKAPVCTPSFQCSTFQVWYSLHVGGFSFYSLCTLIIWDKVNLQKYLSKFSFVLWFLDLTVSHVSDMSAQTSSYCIHKYSRDCFRSVLCSKVAPKTVLWSKSVGWSRIFSEPKHARKGLLMLFARQQQSDLFLCSVMSWEGVLI